MKEPRAAKGPHREDDGRRPYRAPRLVDYGSIPARTLGVMTAGSIFDAMFTTFAKSP